MSGGQDPVGTLEVALQHATRLLGEAPALAIEQADEILKQVPRHPLALLIQGIAKRKLGAESRWTEIQSTNPGLDPKRLADYHEQHVRGLMIGRIGRPDGKAHPDVEAEIARLEAEIARLRAS